MSNNGTQFPDSWVLVPLRSVCESTHTWNPKRDVREQFGYIDVSAVSRATLSISQHQVLNASEAPSRARKLVRTDDVLFATVRPRLRRIALVPEELDDQIASTAFCVIRADRRKAAPHFLYYAVSTNQFIDNIARVESGASYPAVNDKDVLDSRLWLPPITEQDIIAAVLRRNQKSIDVQNRLIVSARDLKQTVMGQLFSRGVREQTNKQTPFGEIPASWQVLPLGECSEVQTGVTKGRAISPDEAIEVPYLRVANVQDGHLDLGEIKTITIRQSEIHTFLLQPGDVVLTEGGDFDKLGRGFIWRGEINPCVHQNHIFAVRAAADVLLPEFLAYLVQSPYGRSYFLTVAHKTTNLASINSTKLKAFPVPLPPLDEQRAIISTLQAIDRKIDVHERKRATLKELFNALLDELMTGRIRVADLDIDLDTAAVAKSQEAP